MAEAGRSPRVTTALTEEIANTRLAIELAEPRVAAALAAQEEADKAIESTDDHAAETLAEFLTDFKHALGIADHNVVVRKRPGTAVPDVLPELCVSQQENSLDDGGIYSVKRLVVTEYAASAAQLGRFDITTLGGLLNSNPEYLAAIKAHGLRGAHTLTHMKVGGIGNANPIQSLDGGAVRRSYVLDDYRGNLQTPRILQPLTAARAQSIGADIALQSTKVANIGISAFAASESGKVIKDGPSRVIEVAVEIGTRGALSGWTGERLGHLVSSACPAVGKVISGLGRVTHAEIVKTTKLTATSGCFTVQIHAEALTT